MKVLIEKERISKSLRILFSGSLPVFVAAVITRAIEALIGLCPTDNITTLVIVLSFLYSLFIAHLGGFYVTYTINAKSPLFSYYFNVATENAGFAWKMTVSLIISKYLLSTKNVSWVICVWFFEIIIAITFIYVSNYIQHNYFNASRKHISWILQFEGEAFALAIAYSFVLIVASLIYVDASSTYLTGMDDYYSVNGNDKDEKYNWLFILYVLGITTLLAYFQIYSKTEGWEEGDILAIVNVREGSNSNASNISYESSNNNNNNDDENKLKITNQTTCIEKIDRYLFSSWDHDGHTKQSLFYLLNTTLGYIVGCSWYTWSVLSFQTIFGGLDSGRVLGLFLYASVMTLVLIYLLGKSTASEVTNDDNNLEVENDDINDLQNNDYDDNNNNVIKKKQTEILLVSGRLIVGWAWEELITSIISLFIPHKENQHLGVSITMKCIFAIAVVPIFAKYILYKKEKIKRIKQENKVKFNPLPTTNLLDHNDLTITSLNNNNNFSSDNPLSNKDKKIIKKISKINNKNTLREPLLYDDNIIEDNNNNLENIYSATL